MSRDDLCGDYRLQDFLLTEPSNSDKIRQRAWEIWNDSDVSGTQPYDPMYIEIAKQQLIKETLNRR